jgi:hypothetical protein
MQGDMTCAFLHANLKENNKVYVEMPLGFGHDGANSKKMMQLVSLELL